MGGLSSFLEEKKSVPQEPAAPRVTMFETGASSVTASRRDPRFSFCTYVPKSYVHEEGRTYPLAVIVHGSERSMENYRTQFTDFAEQHQVMLLCPLFPINALYQGDQHSYKLLRGHGVNYDEILLDMIAEFGERYNVDAARFLLYGFSGGGQFSHRFLYAHPERLAGVSIGAPGTVTLLDDAADYWVGTRNFASLFGHALDTAAMSRVPVQVVIGEDDVLTRWVIVREGDRQFWMEGANDAGDTRVQRIEALQRSLEAHGIAVEHRSFAGVAHDDVTMLEAVKDFFARCLRK